MNIAMQNAFIAGLATGGVIETPSSGLRDELLAGLPHNQNIVAWFDSAEGVEASKWRNLINANDIALYNPTITDGGDVRVDGTQTSYGLYLRKADNPDTVVYSAFTRYYILRKAPNTGYVGDWQTIVGDESVSNNLARATLASSAYGDIWYTRPDLRITGVTYDEWHVIAVRYTNSGTSFYGHGYLYADGAKATENSGQYGPEGWMSGAYFGRGPSWWYEYPKGAIEIRAFLDFDVCHTEEEMLENTAWLRQHYFGVTFASAELTGFTGSVSEQIGG